jgi:hypothetical protein
MHPIIHCLRKIKMESQRENDVEVTKVFRSIPPWQAFCLVVALLVDAGVSWNKFDSMIDTNREMKLSLEKFRIELSDVNASNRILASRVDELYRTMDKLETRLTFVTDTMQRGREIK